MRIRSKFAVWLSLLVVSVSVPGLASNGPLKNSKALKGKGVQGSKGIDYRFKPWGEHLLFKWPLGTLIFPETNDPDKGNEVFLLDHADEPGPQRTLLHRHYGYQLLQKKKFRKAEIEFRKGLKMAPRSAAILGQLGVALTAQKKYRTAERKFRLAIKMNPRNPEAHLNLGNFYYYFRKNYKKARVSYWRALKLNPRLRLARKNLRDINRKFKKWRIKEDKFEDSWTYDNDFDLNSYRDGTGHEMRPEEEADKSKTRKEKGVYKPLF